MSDEIPRAMACLADCAPPYDNKKDYSQSEIAKYTKKRDDETPEERQARIKFFWMHEYECKRRQQRQRGVSTVFNSKTKVRPGSGPLQ